MPRGSSRRRSGGHPGARPAPAPTPAPRPAPPNTPPPGRRAPAPTPRPAPKPAPKPAPRPKPPVRVVPPKPKPKPKPVVTPPPKRVAQKRKEPSYNQEYWAQQKADGVSQAAMKAKQDKISKRKAYSGDRVITKANSATAALKIKKLTGSMATLQNGGVTKTEKKSGLFGERKDTTYDYKRGPKIVTRAIDPTIGGKRFGEKTSTTYVDGVEYATKTGHDPLGRDAKVTRPETAGHITDKVKIPTKGKVSLPVTKPTTGVADQTTASGGPAGTSIQPDVLTNLLAIKKNKLRQGKRSVRNKRGGGGIAAGAGGIGLNITT